MIYLRFPREAWGKFLVWNGFHVFCYLLTLLLTESCGNNGQQRCSVANTFSVEAETRTQFGPWESLLPVHSTRSHATILTDIPVHTTCAILIIPTFKNKLGGRIITCNEVNNLSIFVWELKHRFARNQFLECVSLFTPSTKEKP